MKQASTQLEDYQETQHLDTHNSTRQSTAEFNKNWHPPYMLFTKANWDAALNVQTDITGLRGTFRIPVERFLPPFVALRTLLEIPYWLRPLP